MGSTEKVMDVERDAEDPVGALVDSQMRVVKVTPGTLADGHLQPGDIILSVNNATLKTRDDYYYKLRFAHPRLRLVYRRQEKTDGEEEKTAPGTPQPTLQPAPAQKAAEQALVAKNQTAAIKAGEGTEPSEELEKIITRRPGCKYLVIDFDLPSEPAKGLGIALTTTNHRVIVSGLKKESLGAEKLMVLDRWLAINTILVSDKEVARALVAKMEGKFTVLVERPETPAAKMEHMPKAVPTNVADAPPAGPAVNFADVGGDRRILPADCLLITKTEREKGRIEPEKGILLRPGLRSTSVTSLEQGHTETHIGCDTPANKRLKSVPRRN